MADTGERIISKILIGELAWFVEGNICYPFRVCTAIVENGGMFDVIFDAFTASKDEIVKAWQTKREKFVKRNITVS